MLNEFHNLDILNFEILELKMDKGIHLDNIVEKIQNVEKIQTDYNFQFEEKNKHVPFLWEFDSLDLNNNSFEYFFNFHNNSPLNFLYNHIVIHRRY